RHPRQPLAAGDHRAGVADDGYHFRPGASAVTRTDRFESTTMTSTTYHSIRRLHRVALLLGSALLTACAAVGPDYRTPPPVATGSDWTQPIEADESVDL